MNKDWIQKYIDKEMVILFEGKRYDIPTSFKKNIAIALERAIKTTCKRIEENA